MLYLKEIKETLLAVKKTKNYNKNEDKKVYFINDDNGCDLLFINNDSELKRHVGQKIFDDIVFDFEPLNKVVNLLKGDFDIDIINEWKCKIWEVGSDINYTITYHKSDILRMPEKEQYLSYIGNCNMTEILKNLLVIKPEKYEKRECILSICLRQDVFISTDGKQMVRYNIPNLDTNEDILINKETLTAYQSILGNCNIYNYKNKVELKTSDISLKILKIDGEFYPDNTINNILNLENTNFTGIKTTDFNNLKKLLKIDNDIDMVLTENGTKISSNDFDIKIDFEFKGLKSEGCFDNKKIVDFLKTIQKDKKEIGVDIKSKILYIRSNNLEYCLMSKQNQNR